jgi:hypothetical protein
MRRADYTPRLLAIAFATLAIAGGCTGRVIQIGTNGEPLSTLSPDDVDGVAFACPEGYEHPNVCCAGGPRVPSTCGVYVAHPFRPCDAGWSTYPNPLSCCSLEDGTCLDSPRGTKSMPGSGCAYVCSPGWWPDPSSSVSSDGAHTTACCRTRADGVAECMDDGSTPNGSSTACGPDAGANASGEGGGPTSDAGTTSPDPVPPSSCIDAGAPPVAVCDPECPAGWTADAASPALCCRGAGAERACFSRATVGSLFGDDDPGSVPPSPADASVTPAPGLACSGGIDGGTCSCNASSGGHAYAITCDDGAHSCTCVIDSVPGKTFPYDGTACVAGGAELQKHWATCGFPP